VAPLRGRPLLAWAVDAARESKLFDDVWVSTDDAAIATIARGQGALVHDRPADLATDTATIAQVAIDFLDWLAARGTPREVLCIVLPTAALLRPDDLRGGWELFRARDAEYAIATTTYLESPFWALEEVDGYLRLFFGDDYARATQKLPEVRVDAGYFYFIRAEALRRERRLYGPRLVGYPIPRERAIDIDEPGHLVMAEALLEAMDRTNAAIR
jgi:CMP-N-acetylneuraminic acid synthetase